MRLNKMKLKTMTNSLFKKLTINSESQLRNKYPNETETKEGKLGMSIISS